MGQDFRATMQQFFEQKRLTNPAYSLNAYARDLDLYPSHLHDILNGRKGLSAKTAKKIAERLFTEAGERRLFVDHVMAECSRAGADKTLAKKRLLKQLQLVHEELAAEMFQIVKDWHHAALREYARAQGAKFSVEAAAKYFSLPVKLLRDSLESMEKVGLMKRTRAGRWLPSEPTLHAPVGVPSMAKKMHHLQLMNIAQRAYLTQDFNRRDYMSSILAVDPEKIPEAKKLIREFHENMNKLLAGSPPAGRAEVFGFVTQLFSFEQGGEGA